ncbi:MAG: ATP-dependent DNA helicase UvrD2, partial [Acidimicrobiales bacterium]
GMSVVHRWNTESGSLEVIGEQPPTSELAPDQRAAVTHLVGGARVIAPAGSGKTRVLTERLRHLVTDRRVDPSMVTALAFNTKAAEEMRRRCSALVRTAGPYIRTLNSVGLWICNEYGGAGHLRTIEELEVRELIQQLFEVRRQANADTVLPYVDALSAIRLGLASPQSMEEEIPDAIGIGAGFDRYRAALADSRLLDFDEQIYLAIEILLTDPGARTAAQARCRLLLVDEFQDLNPAHMLLIRLLSAPAYNCFGVGDDDQVIYGYSGATPKFLIDFASYFPGSGHHALEVNYRCPAAIVTAASQLLSYNRDRVHKKIRVAGGRIEEPLPVAGPLKGTGSLHVLTAHRQALTEQAIKVVEAWRGAGVPWGQIAVLARVNSALLPTQVACTEAGIPCTVPLDAKVLNRTGIRTALAYLRIGLAPGSITLEDIQQTIRRPSRGIAPNVAEMLTGRGSTSIADIRHLAGRLSGRDVPKLLSYAEDLDTLVVACRESSEAALCAIRTKVGLGETMDVLDSSKREADRSTHTDDLLALESVAALHPDAATFEPWLRALLHRSGPQDDAVLLSTIHKIKGREWDHVIVFGASNGLLPHRLSDDEEGERRVFHVALTRARRQVVILADVAEPSVFLAELDGRRPRVSGSRQRAERSRRAAVGRTRAPSIAGDGSAREETTVLRPRRSRKARRQSLEPTVAASVGMAIEHGGYQGQILELGDVDVVMQVGAAKVRVKYGSDVTVEGRTMKLVGPGTTASSSREPVETALRAWRTEVANRENVPAYVVMNDTELSGIVARCPKTLAELAGCRGMGPIRIERYGDEVLAVLGGAGEEHPSV